MMKGGQGLAGRFFGLGLTVMILLMSGCGPEVKDEISATGTIEMTETIVSSKLSGRVIRMYFDEGQWVKVGDLLAEMEHDQLDAQIQAARSSLQAFQANRNAAERDLNRLRKLLQDELISRAEYERAITSWEVYDAQVKQQEANLNLLKVQLSDTRLIAPVNGIISAKLVEPGEMALPGTALYAILDQNRPWVKVYLPLVEVEQISLNQLAIVKLDAFPDLNFEGRISYISQEAEFTPKDYLSKEERVKQVYEVKVQLDNSSGKLKAGIPAEVRIKLDQGFKSKVSKVD